MHLQPILLFASTLQNDASAYAAGRATGRVVGFLLVAALVVWGIQKARSKQGS